MHTRLWKLRQLKVRVVTSVDLHRRTDEGLKDFLIKSDDFRRNDFRSIKN